MPSKQAAAASATFGRLLATQTWLGPVIQQHGPPLRRLECVLGRRWRGVATAISDPALSNAAVDLIDRRCPPVKGADHRTWLGIDRPFLKKLSAGARTSDQDLVQLWLATMMWGYATDNRGPSRVGKAMNQSWATFVRKLRLSLERIDNRQFVDAYRGSQSQGLSYLPGIADSFFTKWFWTVSLGNPRLPLTLLIFDGRVAGSATGKTWALQGKNVAERYVYLCELVELVATAQGLSSEQVEYGLYCAG